MGWLLDTLGVDGVDIFGIVLGVGEEYTPKGEEKEICLPGNMVVGTNDGNLHSSNTISLEINNLPLGFRHL